MKLSTRASWMRHAQSRPAAFSKRLGVDGLAAIAQPSSHRGRQTDQPVRLARQQNPAVAGDLATRKISLDAPPAAGWKIKPQRATIRYRRILALEAIIMLAPMIILAPIIILAPMIILADVSASPDPRSVSCGASRGIFGRFAGGLEL